MNKYELAEQWVFDKNGHKWSNNNGEAGDNYGSFIAGWEAADKFRETNPMNKREGLMCELLGIERLLEKVGSPPFTSISLGQRQEEIKEKLSLLDTSTTETI